MKWKCVAWRSAERMCMGSAHLMAGTGTDADDKMPFWVAHLGKVRGRWSHIRKPHAITGGADGPDGEP